MSDRDDQPTDSLWADVALSGGGFRATLWGFGTLFGLLRARNRNPEDAPEIRIASVASVSGGSLANGVVAHEIDDLNSVGEADYLAAVKPAVANIAGEGLIPGRPTRTYLWTLIVCAGAALLTALIVAGAVASAGRDWGFAAFTVPVIAFAVAALLFGLWRGIRGGSVPAKRLIMQTAGAAVAGAVLGLGLWIGTLLAGWQATRLLLLIGILSGLLWWLAFALFAARGRVVENTLARMFFTTDDRPTLLSDLSGRVVHHVFCATELQSGDHIYLTPKLLHGFLLGEAPHPAISLAQAVQASASLPGAFPPQETELLPAVELQRDWDVPDDAPTVPVRRMVLVDGGVYDNMGEQWTAGFAGRAHRSSLVRDSQPMARFQVVANAGAALEWKTMLPTNRVWREIRGLIRDQSVQYDATTSQRRRAVVAGFRAGEASGKGPIGVIIHMGTSPADICAAFQKSPDAAQRNRARAAREALGDPERWKQVVRRNGKVGTVLSTLSREAVLDLVEHATTLTLTALYVVHGIGTAEFPSRSELRALFNIG